MNYNLNLENIQQQCRICLQKGDINIRHYKVSFQPEAEMPEDSLDSSVGIEKSFLELMDIFYDSQDLLCLTDEFPTLCWQCLDDLKYCYSFYEKIKLANIQLANLYQESLNQCIEEEHLIEVVEERPINEFNEIADINIIETLEEDEQLLQFPAYSINEAKQLHTFSKTHRSKHMPLDKNDAFVITQFVPETVDASERIVCNTSKEDEEEFQAPQHLLTVNLKAVEVRDIKNLENLAITPSISTDETEPAVYICQYCPQAFAKSDYLKTHIQKSHVCKFCTQTFSVTEELFKHIREIHTEHKCAICHKLLSSHTNLRHHIKRVHRIKLPAKVTLLDFIKATDVELEVHENDVEMLGEELGTPEMDFNAQYLWQNDDSLEMFNENNAIESNLKTL